MSDGHISILGNRRAVCYKCNITDFPWNTFPLEGKYYPHTKNGIEWLKYMWLKYMTSEPFERILIGL